MRLKHYISVGIPLLVSQIAAPLLAQVCLPPPQGLIAWWRGNGNPLDYSGTNDSFNVGGVSYAPGKVGLGFKFSGDGGDFIRLPERVFPIPHEGESRDAFSFEAWFQTTASGVILGQQDVSTFVDLGGYVPAIYIGTNGHVFASLFWSTAPLLESGEPYNDGLFHHLAVTHDGYSQTLFLNGKPVASTPFTQLGYSDTYFYQLGTGFTGGWPETPGGWFPFLGVLDEVSVYHRALTPEEVNSIYAAGAAGKCSGLVLRHRYSFDGQPGQTQVHDSIRGGHGTLQFDSVAIQDGSGFNGTGILQLRGSSGYVALPPRIVSQLASVTIEAWISWNGPRTSAWQRVFDFGSHNQISGQGRQGTNYMMFSPSRGDKYVMGFQQTTVNPLSGAIDPAGATVLGPDVMPVDREVFLAITYDPQAASCSIYLDGELVSSSVASPLNQLNRFLDENNWLGRSQWGLDPLFNGSFNEFRIWDGILSRADIAGHFAAGPDEVFQLSAPSIRIEPAGADFSLSWPATEPLRFFVERSAGLPFNWQMVPGTPVRDGGRYKQLISASEYAGFFRLRSAP